MKLLVAVSGGVDSVVLLDALTKTSHDLVVAHFDHGIREDSEADSRFVKALADQYGLPCVSRREELGAGASEAHARQRRYLFLFGAAKQEQACLVTAHHRDDVLATIAINIKRGTGWRGLAVFGDTRIARPLLGITKQQLRGYALQNRLEWVEDKTNYETKYLRNQLNRQVKLSLKEEEAQQLETLWFSQTRLAAEIDAATSSYETLSSRYFLSCCGDTAAFEILQSQCRSLLGQSVTASQLARLVLAIKIARPGTQYDIEHGWRLQLTTRQFSILPPLKMLL